MAVGCSWSLRRESTTCWERRQNPCGNPTPFGRVALRCTYGYGGAIKGVRIIKQRMNVREAAEALGISSEGIRQRIRRGTLESDKGTDGRVYVWLDENADGGVGTERDTHGVITRLENEVEWLRREVERKDTLLMTLMHRVPELEAPQRPSEARQGTGEGADEGSHHPEGTGAQTGAERRSSWWRRWFGFE